MKPSLSRAAFGSVIVTCCLVVAGQPASAEPVAPRSVVDDAPAWTSTAPVVADTPSAQVENLSVVLNLKDEAGAEALAESVSDPSSASYRQFVAGADWRARFAPTDETVAKVTDWLTAQGFSVGAVPDNHRLIPFSGTAAQAEAAFGTDLKEYDKSGTPTTAPAAAVSVPTELAGLVAGIGGLDVGAKATPLHLTGADAVASEASAAKTDAAAAAAPATTIPADELPPPDPVFKNGTPCSTYFGEKAATDVPQILTDALTYAPCGYKPAQLRGAYGSDELQNVGLDGRGTTVAVVDAFASPYIFDDVAQYAAANDPSHPFRDYQFDQLLPTGYRYTDECGAGGWYGEETLDVEAVHAMAPAANVLYVGAQSCDDPDILAAVNSVVDNNLAQVVTNSYGDAGEPEASAVVGEHQTYLQAAAQGITMLFSSGDDGDEIADIGTRSADYPASDPWVTAVGGTSLAVGADDNYLFEQGWGTGKSVLDDSTNTWSPVPPAYVYGGGGGTSQLFKQPKYQQGVVPDEISNYFGTGKHRAVPDVAMVGDPNTGFLMGQSQSFPDGSIQYSEYRIGGTSLASPLMAGLVAVADQVYGGSVGFLNYGLYKAVGSVALHDIANGEDVTDGVVREDFANGFDAADGVITSLRTLSQTGTIFTRPGYDDVTGVGTPDIDGLISLVSGAGGYGSSSGGSTTSGGLTGPGGGVRGGPAN